MRAIPFGSWMRMAIMVVAAAFAADRSDQSDLSDIVCAHQSTSAQTTWGIDRQFVRRGTDVYGVVGANYHSRLCGAYNSWRGG